MTKGALEAQLNNTLHSLLLGNIAWQSVPSEKWKEMEKEGFAALDEQGNQLTIPLEALAKSMQFARDLTTKELEKCLRRAMLREIYELILNFCEDTGQKTSFRAAPFYWFLRILRNTVSHKNAEVIRVWPRELREGNIPTVTWRHRVFERSKLDEPVLFTLNEALTLFFEARQFVREELLEVT